MPKRPETVLIAGFNAGPLRLLLREHEKISAENEQLQADLPAWEQEIHDFMQNLPDVNPRSTEFLELLKPIEMKRTKVEMAPNFLRRYQERMGAIEKQIEPILPDLEEAIRRVSIDKHTALVAEISEKLSPFCDPGESQQIATGIRKCRAIIGQAMTWNFPGSPVLTRARAGLALLESLVSESPASAEAVAVTQ